MTQKYSKKSVSYCKNPTPDKKCCWSQSLLGTSCLGADTICTSVQHRSALTITVKHISALIITEQHRSTPTNTIQHRYALTIIVQHIPDLIITVQQRCAPTLPCLFGVISKPEQTCSPEMSPILCNIANFINITNCLWKWIYLKEFSGDCKGKLCWHSPAT